MKSHSFLQPSLAVLSVASTFLLMAAPAYAATPTAILSLTPATANVTSGNTLAVDVVLDTGGQGVGGVDIHLTVPSGLSYTSYDASTSVFTSEANPPTVSGSDLHLARLLTAAGGYSGANGEVIHLVFTTSGPASTAQLAFNQSTSAVSAYSDSTNILSSVNNGTYAIVPPVSATAKPAIKSMSLPMTGSPVLEEMVVTLLSLGAGVLAVWRIRKEF